MAKLYVHGHPVIDYVRYTDDTDERGPGGYEVTFRLMSDGKLLKKFRSNTAGRWNRATKWKIAHVKPEIAANPDRLIELGFKKKTIGPVAEDDIERDRR